MAKFDAYVICTSPRSGSTLLCKLLAGTGVAGNPDSYFHRPCLDAWCEDLELEPEPSLSEREVLGLVFRAAIAEGSLDTGMFGFRLQRHSFDFFTRQLEVLHPDLPGDAARLEATFGRTAFIYLKRHDKVEQAVSYVKASQSGLWHMAPDGTELERLAPPQEPAYDFSALRAQFDEMTEADRAWERWFDQEEIEPLRLAYEDLAADPVAALRTVLVHLGLDRQAADGVNPTVARLADETNREWVERFRAETRGS